MDFTLSHLFTLITLVISVGGTVFSIGVYFGFIRGKFAIYDETTLDFYKHSNDDTKHFSKRDWEHLDLRLEKLETNVERMNDKLDKLLGRA